MNRPRINRMDREHINAQMRKHRVIRSRKAILRYFYNRFDGFATCKERRRAMYIYAVKRWAV